MDFWLIVQHDGGERRFRLDADDSILGTAPDCDVRLDHPTVSRRHAQLSRDGGNFVLTDLGSTNGSFVGLRRVREQRVAPGDLLRFGEVSARIENHDAAELPLRIDLHSEADAAPSAWRTQVGDASSRFLLRQLPALLRALAEGVDMGALTRRSVAALAQAYPDRRFAIERGDTDACIAGDATLVAGEGAATVDSPPLRLVFDADGAPAELPIVAAMVLDLLRASDVGARGGEADDVRDDASAPAPPEPASVDARLRGIYRAAARIASARDIQVLIEGESGTGKELLARYLHDAGGARGPLLALNCAALPRDLLEAELFGIERGVATGVDARAGLFEQADGGTLFLDEVGDMAADVQAKLLRVLQEGMVTRLGGRTPRRIDVRIVAATNRDLARDVERGAFRLDLYHRIADWSVRLPSLRERPADLLNLAAHFLERECRKRGLSSVGLSRDAVQALRAYAWPGNVRELEREMRRAALFLENGQVLDAALLSERIRAAGERASGRESALDEAMLRAAIDDAGGNMSAAAERLGVARSTLYRRMKALGIDDR